MSATPRPFTIFGGGRAPGGIFYGANGQTITGNSSGAWTIAPNGTNQSITLTPSGTGKNVLTANTQGAAAIIPFRAGASSRNWGFTIDQHADGDFEIQNSSAKTAGLLDQVALRITPSRMFLFGGLTTDGGNGMLQLPTHTTSSGGIGFGTDTALYRSSAGSLDIDHIGGALPTLQLKSGGSRKAYLAVSGNNVSLNSDSGSTILSTGGTTALTLDTSQNATGVGYSQGWTRRVQAKTQAVSPYAVSATTENGNVFTNEGATGMVTFTLPTAAANLHYTFFVQDADGVTITAASGDTIRWAGSVTAAAGSIANSTIGGSITLVAINATEWVATSIVGTWA